MRGVVQPGAVEIARLAGSEDFERGQCVEVAGGRVAAERRAFEFGDLAPFDEAEEGAGLVLEAAEFQSESHLITL